MFRWLFELFRGRQTPKVPEQSAPEPTNSCEISADATFEDKPYDRNKRLRILVVELHHDGDESSGVYDLQFVRQGMSLYMMFANGTFEQLRIECESLEAHDLLVQLAQNVGAYVSCSGEEPELPKCPMFREGYEAYRCDPVDGIYMFVNPQPNLDAFPPVE